MHRIDGDANYPTGFFSEGDPGVPRLPTQVTADWLNDVQEALTLVIEAAGFTLAKGNYTQLRNAVLRAAGAGQTIAAPHTLGVPLTFGHADPDPDPPYTSLAGKLYSAAVARAWGVLVTDGFGSVQLLSGAVGISATITITSTYLEITLTTPVEVFASVIATNADTLGRFVTAVEQSAGVYRLYVYTASTGVLVNPSTAVANLQVVVFGRDSSL